MSKDNNFYKNRKIFIIIDNIRSAFNVGSIFRTADAVGDCFIIICGIAPTPENPKVLKTSLHSEKSVPWIYMDNTKSAIETLRSKDIDVFAIETGIDSIDYKSAKYKKQVGIILGHEKRGVEKDTIALTDGVISIPMNGVKKSLNVAVCTGIILFDISWKLQ